jgi:PAS domain S-box-containing protein
MSATAATRFSGGEVQRDECHDRAGTQAAQGSAGIDAWRLAPLLMVAMDPRATLLDVNPAWTRVLGWAAHETIGRPLQDFLVQRDRQSEAQKLPDLLQPGEYETLLASRSGDHRRIAWSMVRGEAAIFGYGRDITDHMLAEEQQRQAERIDAVGELTGGIAHDFNNLLTGIGGSLELLEIRAAQGKLADLGRYTGLAQGSVRRAATLTQRLLAFARRQPLQPQPTGLDLLVAAMAERLQEEVGPGVAIRTMAAPGLRPALVDRGQLQTVLLNLASNARDAMPDGGTMTIELANEDLPDSPAWGWDLKPGPYVGLAVTDTGIGMPPEMVRRAFDPFFTTKKPGDGNGLGLSLVYGFVHQSGGQVRIRSAPGQGCTVEMRLPAAPEPETAG